MKLIVYCVFEINWNKATTMYFDDLQTNREKARLTISDLAKETGLDRKTITRIENHFCARKVNLSKIVDALNKHGLSLDENIVITETSRYGRGLDIETLKLSKI